MILKLLPDENSTIHQQLANWKKSNRLTYSQVAAQKTTQRDKNQNNYW
ncbi:33694_t:CDS:1, partial [Racocetra persica]